MSPDHFAASEGGYGRGAESIEELRPEVIAKYLEPPTYLTPEQVVNEHPLYVAVNSFRLWKDPRSCPHYNDNACATCDFDGYYETKYGTVCPWKEFG